MSNSLEVTRPPVVLGIHVSADIADIVRQRAIARTLLWIVVGLLRRASADPHQRKDRNDRT
jgi:hypothetical protein